MAGVVDGLPSIGEETVVDRKDLCHDLQNGLHRKRLQALKSMQNQGVTIETCPNMMAAISSCMTAAQADVRAMAVKTVGSLAKPGDQKYIDLVSERLTDEHWSVRKAAVESCGRIDMKGDANMIASVGGMIRDSRDEVRTVALDVFAQLAFKGDTQHALAFTKMNAFLEDMNPEVRRTAVLAIGILARRGRMPLMHRGNNMFMSKGAKQQLAPRQEVKKPEMLRDRLMLQPFITAIEKKLRDAHPEVRRTAVEVLGQCLFMGDAKTVASLQTCLKDRVWSVRKAAVEALCCLQDNEAQVKATVGAMVKDSHASVRKAASTALRFQSTEISTPRIKENAGYSWCCFSR
eukprot:CAMPEP_0172824644 /NCGR_PEP_ID=MMETSP1075-20121228/18141_1 /TAXON_ID=2916 /ORGANISM="Ceratium fusus, Strain PA161109" /LENGTH=346 /DNA_ID=CAMNT_0013665955 /DNA_START=35 /DNA_END=1071 /DNA_ORIENTATION=+